MPATLGSPPGFARSWARTGIPVVREYQEEYFSRVGVVVDTDKEAADEFTKAIQDNPREQGPYVALSELYRKWDYTDQAIQVASCDVHSAGMNHPCAAGVADIISSRWWVDTIIYYEPRP